MTGETLTLKKGYAFLKCCDPILYKDSKEGKNPGVKVGGDWRYLRPRLERMLHKKIEER